MREINHIVIHCSATPPSMDIGVDEIRRWHTEERGWKDIGYHFVVRRDGTLEEGRQIGRSGAHVRGYNADSIGVCYIGGISESGKAEDNRTADQSRVLFETVSSLKERFPNAEVLGHRDFPGVRKACPCFDVKQWYNDSCNTEKKALEPGEKQRVEEKQEAQVKKEPEKTDPQSMTFKSILSIILKPWTLLLFSRRQSVE